MTGRRISGVYVMSGCFPVYGAEDNGRLVTSLMEI